MKLRKGDIWVKVDLDKFRRYCRPKNGGNYSERHLRRIVAAWRTADEDATDIALSVFFDVRRLRWVLMASRASNLRWDRMPLFFTRDGLDRCTRPELSEKFFKMRHRSKGQPAPSQAQLRAECTEQPKFEPEPSECTEQPKFEPEPSECTEQPKFEPEPSASVTTADESCPHCASQASPSVNDKVKNTRPAFKDSFSPQVHDILPIPTIEGFLNRNQQKNISSGRPDRPDPLNSLGGAEMPKSKPSPKPRENRRYSRGAQRKAFALMPFLEFCHTRHGRPVGWWPKHAWSFCVSALMKGNYEDDIFEAWENAVLAVHKDNLDKVTRHEPALLMFHANRILRDLRRRRFQK